MKHLTCLLLAGLSLALPQPLQAAPAQVSFTQSAETVKYTLVTPNVDSRTGRPMSGFEERTYGTLLVKLVEDRKLRLEVFAGRTQGEVKDFTTEARTYER